MILQLESTAFLVASSVNEEKMQRQGLSALSLEGSSRKSRKTRGENWYCEGKSQRD